jgi:hypothetical protein
MAELLLVLHTDRQHMLAPVNTSWAAAVKRNTCLRVLLLQAASICCVPACW